MSVVECDTKVGNNKPEFVFSFSTEVCTLFIRGITLQAKNFFQCTFQSSQVYLIILALFYTKVNYTNQSMEMLELLLTQSSWSKDISETNLKLQIPCSKCMYWPVMSQADACTSQAYACMYCFIAP
jgi:hypothetical protein